MRRPAAAAGSRPAAAAAAATGSLPAAAAAAAAATAGSRLAAAPAPGRQGCTEAHKAYSKAYHQTLKATNDKDEPIQTITAKPFGLF